MGYLGNKMSWEVEPLHLVHHLHFSQGGNWINLDLLANPAAIPPVTLGPEVCCRAENKLKEVRFNASSSL